MSVYLDRGKGWRYDFVRNGERYSKSPFRTRREAVRAEAKRREEVETAESSKEPTPIDMGFLELVNRRLDYLRAYRSEKYYGDTRYLAKRWVAEWGRRKAGEVTGEAVERFVLSRSEVSPNTANVELRSLRAMFNFGKKKKWITSNPTERLEFLPVEKPIKYIPSLEDIERVMQEADPESRDYLGAIQETMARVNEVDQLRWEDVDLGNRSVVLYTRKKRGGNRTPRTIPMTDKLFEILSRRFKERDASQPWVFWHTYKKRETGEMVSGPYGYRKLLMKGLCNRAGVRHFGFHALRHAGASLLDRNNVPMGSIQRILGHENRSTTEIYLHSIGQPEREAMEVFERARGQGSEKKSPQIPRTYEGLRLAPNEPDNPKPLTYMGLKLELAKGIEPPTC